MLNKHIYEKYSSTLLNIAFAMFSFEQILFW